MSVTVAVGVFLGAYVLIASEKVNRVTVALNALLWPTGSAVR
jgi:hypothetical protein